MTDYPQILEPIVAICLRKNMRFRWKTWEEEGHWLASVQMYHPDGNGARPVWQETSDTEDAALSRAVGHAVQYWGGDGRGIETSFADN